MSQKFRKLKERLTGDEEEVERSSVQEARDAAAEMMEDVCPAMVKLFEWLIINLTPSSADIPAAHHRFRGVLCTWLHYCVWQLLSHS